MPGLPARLENGGLEGVNIGCFQLFRQPVTKTRTQVDVPTAFVPIPALVFGMRGLVRLPDTIERPAAFIRQPCRLFRRPPFGIGLLFPGNANSPNQISFCSSHAFRFTAYGLLNLL